MTKPGFIFSSRLPGGFAYSPSYAKQHLPDASNPVMFTMWEKGNSEPLIKNQWRKRVTPNGEVATFDLLSPAIIERENLEHLRISIIADYESGTNNTNYPWTAVVEAPNGGGIQQTNQPHPYQAPDDGYTPRLKFSIPHEDGSWSRDINFTIYIRGPGDAYYATANIKIIVFHTNTASIAMETILNPAGSRNLEFDPNNLINR